MDLYQHFRPDEKPFIDELLHWAANTKERYIPKRSDFLDPRQQHIATSVLGNDDEVTLSFCGGSPHAERKRLVLLPPYRQPEDNDYGIVLFSVDYPEKFASLTHRDLLGALMSLGIRRDKFGDLLLKGGQVQLIAAAEISEYLRLNLTEVGSHPVELKELSMSDVLQVEEQWSERDGTVASLRLDVVLAEIYRVSRSKMTPLIKKGRVKVNWKAVEDPSYPLQAGDTLSVRGMGRSKLISVEGKTKKDKWRIVAGISIEQK